MQEDAAEWVSALPRGRARLSVSRCCAHGETRTCRGPRTVGEESRPANLLALAQNLTHAVDLILSNGCGQYLHAIILLEADYARTSPGGSIHDVSASLMRPAAVRETQGKD